MLDDEHGTAHAARDHRDDAILAAGMLLWLAALVALWPAALSFGDEVGYIGQIKVFLTGHMRPSPGDPGIWFDLGTGPVAKFPPFVPLLLTPLYALAPRLVFASGVAAALALAFVTSRALRAWGHRSTWALLVLAHPTVIVIARTVMVDLMLAAFSVGAWWALRRGRSLLSAVLFAAVVCTKPTGLVIAPALLAGEALRVRQALGRRDRPTLARLGYAGLGIGAGIIVTVALNLLGAGQLWYAYSHAHQYLHGPAFRPSFFSRSAPVHAASLLLLPPLLLAGAVPLWRRRELGPLLVAAALGGLMCFYFFVDTGRSRFETLVLSQRLILPVVAFLLLGYADGLAALMARAARLWPLFAAALVLAPALTALAISTRHRRWQEPGKAALAVAETAVAERGSGELGLLHESIKVGLMFRGPTRIVAPEAAAGAPGVVLCSEQTSSYRTAPTERLASCALPGYDDLGARDSFHVLVRHGH
jgi:hypothetical protein